MLLNTELREKYVELSTELIDNYYYIDKYNTESAMRKNIGFYMENKAHLYELLKTSPYWDEEGLCIRLPHEKTYEINFPLISLCISRLSNYLCGEKDIVIRGTRDFVERDMSAYSLSDYVITDFWNSTPPFRINKGEKYSRVIRRIIDSYEIKDLIIDFTGCDEIPYVKKKRDDGTYYENKLYNIEQWFALVSDSLKSYTEKNTIIISINPMDYLTQSHGNSWSSCHSLKNKGCYHAATLTMLTDESSVIAYTLPNEKYAYASDCWSVNKKSRQSLFINKEHTRISQNTWYPKCDTKLSECVRKHIEELIANEKGVQNEWVKTEKVDYENIYDEDYLGYKDWDNGKVFITAKLKGAEDYSISIGNVAHCIDDSGYLESSETLQRGIRCDECDEYFSEDLTYIDYYDITVCSDCLDRYFVWCDDISDYRREEDAYWVESRECWYGDFDNVCRCEYTGDWFDYDDVVEVVGYGYVNDYDLENSGDFVQCDECGDWYRVGDIEYNEEEDKYICENCL